MKLKQPPPVYESVPPANYLRFRLGSEATIAVGAMVKRPGDELVGEETELLVSHDEDSFQADPYEQLLGDAMNGEPFRFAREDYVEEAWRIMDGIVGAASKPIEYEPGSWGPRRPRSVTPGAWHDPQGAR